jgi:hypothetical protein
MAIEPCSIYLFSRLARVTNIMFISLRKKWCLHICEGHCASSLKTRVACCVNNVMCDMMIEVEVSMRCPLFGPIVLRPMVVWIPLQLQIRFPLTRQVLHITSSAEAWTQMWLACATHGMSCMSLAGVAHYICSRAIKSRLVWQWLELWQYETSPTSGIPSSRIWLARHR